MSLFRKFMPLLLLLFGANLLLTVLRDIKEDFIVCIIDVSTISSWLFARLDAIATLIMLAVFALLGRTRSHRTVLGILLLLSTLGMGALVLIAGCPEGTFTTATWLFMQTLCLDIAYLSFQTIFFERFIACYKIKGNVGFFIITIDFIGYVGTLLLLFFKEFFASQIDWHTFYNEMTVYIGIFCCVAFAASWGYIQYYRDRQKKSNSEELESAGSFTSEKLNVECI